MALIILIIFIVAIIFIWNIYVTKKRKEYLLNKYGNAEIVEKIMNRYFWVGQTAEQLRDSLGKPADISTKIMKTRYRETWKYNQTGKNR